MLTPTQEALLLLRACHAHRLSLPDGIRRWRRSGDDISVRTVHLAETAIQEAGAWLALPARDQWLAFQWSAAIAVAVIALDVRQRAVPNEDAESRPQAVS